MDNFGLYLVVQKLPHLRYKYLGTFSPSSMIPLSLMQPNTFQITNTTNGSGEHWVLFMKRSSPFRVYYADSLGKNYWNYAALRSALKDVRCADVFNLTPFPTQNSADLCGFYCIYFASLFYSDRFDKSILNDYELARFVQKIS